MIRRLLVLALASASLVVPLAAPAADVTEVASVKYDNTITLANTKLQLNGAGIRYKFVKVYTAALYLANKAATPEAVLAANGPRRMHIVMLREINAEELGRLFTKGMEQNASREEFSKVIPGVIKMGEMFAARKKLVAGDYFSIDYVPGVGSTILVNGKVETGPIKEPEFFASLMKIWLGKNPADAQLKEALLGHTKGNDPFN